MTDKAQPAFLDRLARQDRPLLLDGAMGTMLHNLGVGFEECFDELNLTRPALVAEVHHAYLDAGAELLLTNTFGANRFKLESHGLSGKVAELNRAGAEIAREAAGDSVYVAVPDRPLPRRAGRGSARGAGGRRLAKSLGRP